MFDTLIRDTTIVDPVRGTYLGSVGISDGRIAAVAASPTGLQARTSIDGSGLCLFPGLIDPHTHLGYANEFAQDVVTETRSAALGGVTTVLSFHRHYGGAEPQPYRDLDVLKGVITDNATVDVGLHLGILTEAQAGELDRYIAEGVSSFKFYMAYRGEDGRTVGMINECDDGILLDAFETLAKTPHAVAGVHCENTEIIKRSVARVKAEGAGDLDAWHRARPPVGEIESVRRVGFFARRTGANLYLVHIGSPEVVAAALGEQRRSGARVWIETCPHYLTHTIDSEVGTLAKINPPVRTQEAVDAMWDRILAGDIDTLGTDHCAVARASKAGDIWEASAGFAGMGTLLPVLLDEGYHRRGFSLDSIARISSFNPARIFNLYPRKGCIEIGADADLVLVDLGLQRTVDSADLESASDFSIYEGRTLTGWPVMTMVRGRVVAQDGEVVAEPGAGEFIAR